MTQWYCTIGGQRYGPVDEEVLRQWIAQGRVGPNDLIWSEGMPSWVTASTVPNLFVGLPPPTPPSPVAPELKSKIAGGLLGIFLGGFGVHNFYLGYTGKAIAQLLISVLSCFILYPVSHIWGLIEGILILTGSINVDAQGKPLRD